MPPVPPPFPTEPPAGYWSPTDLQARVAALEVQIEQLIDELFVCDVIRRVPRRPAVAQDLQPRERQLRER